MTALPACRAVPHSHTPLFGRGSFASIYQKPRTDVEDEAFSGALSVMGDLCTRNKRHGRWPIAFYFLVVIVLRGVCDCACADASAVGTTMLQLQEIPPRPEEYNGALYLGEPALGIDEEMVKRHFRVGLLSCDLQRNPAVLRFHTHEAALTALQKGPGELGVWLDVMYNERKYGDRGWCVHALLVLPEVAVYSPYSPLPMACPSIVSGLEAANL